MQCLCGITSFDRALAGLQAGIKVVGDIDGDGVIYLPERPDHMGEPGELES